MNRIIIAFILVQALLLSGCSDRYLAYKKLYNFRSSNGIPDYRSLDYWAAHPWKWDPSDSIPRPLRAAPRDSAVDVFFLHPTTFTKKKYKSHPNARIDDSYINAKTDYSSILYQASVFNQHGRVFAPRYRQAHIWNFFRKDKQKAGNAFSLAYEDLKHSFEYYLEHWNNGRPIIIAGHSQGSMFAEQLLKDYFFNKPLQKQLVVAYIIGWPVPKDFTNIEKICNTPFQTGCICSWRTLKKGYVPWYLRNEKGNSYVTNPLSWSIGSEHISSIYNKGSVLRHFNKVYPHTTDAQIENGLLYVKKPKFPGSFLLPIRNYHIGDINLYYVNLRENVAQRIENFMKFVY